LLHSAPPPISTQLGLGRGRCDFADDRPAGHYQDTVGQPPDFVELDGDEQDGAAPRDETAMDVVERADVVE
jgi:hypothetical protein